MNTNQPPSPQGEGRGGASIRRTLLADYYDLPAAQQQEADELFARMDALAEECADQGEFEKRLAASPLTQEYTDMLTRFAPYVRRDPEQEASIKRERAAARRQNIKDNVRQQARSAVLHELNNRLPMGDYRWGEPWYWAIPVLGPLLKRISGTADQVRGLQTFGRNPLEDNKKTQ